MNTPSGFIRKDWRKLLGEVKYSIDRPYWGRAAKVWYLTQMNTRFQKQEIAEYGAAIERAQIKEPIFILGHWRSGTTLMHELLALDEQFAYPNLFEISRPHTFLVREPVIEKQAARAAPIKRPMDNMTVTFRSPGEDEPALAVLSFWAMSNRTYTVQYRDSLEPGPWQRLADLPAPDTNRLVTVSDVSLERSGPG